MSVQTDIEPRRTPYIKNLSVPMRRMLIEHLDGPRAIKREDPSYATLLSLNSRGLIRFDGRIAPRFTRLTEQGHAKALACAALEAEHWLELEDAR